MIPKFSLICFFSFLFVFANAKTIKNSVTSPLKNKETGLFSAASAPSYVNGATQTLSTCQNASSISLTSYLNVNDLDAGQVITWKITTVSSKGTLAGFPAAIGSNGGTVAPTGVTYTPTTNASGTDRFVISVDDGTTTVTTTINVTINPLPTVAATTGTTTVCNGLSNTLANASTGGVWSSSDVTTASVNSTGTYTGVSAGTTTILYTITDSKTGCSASATSTIQVFAYPVGQALTGNNNVCVGNTTQLTPTTTGGTWTSSNTAVLTVDATGLIKGITSGTATISYTITNGGNCSRTATRNITVNASPTVAAITATTTSICVGNTTTFTETNPGNQNTTAWSSSNTAVATASTGSATSSTITGVSAGIATISYTVTSRFNNCSTAVTKAITVSAKPSAGTISGPGAVCSGSTTKLTSTVAGGVWSSGNTAIATIDASTGTVTSIIGGAVATFIYTVTTNGCSSTATYNLNIFSSPAVAAITGTNTVCKGGTTTLTQTTTGGTWSSSDASIATITTSGLVSGISNGSATINYTVSNGTCATTVSFPLTVSSTLNIGSITGPSEVCVGSTINLENATSGGTWTNVDQNVSVVTSTGLVAGLSAGVDTIKYTVSSGGGCSATATYAITVFDSPSLQPIAGPTSVCIGKTITLTNSTSGGFWISDNNSIGTISSSGVVSGISSGTITATYTVIGSGGCSNSATYGVNVNALPIINATTGSNATCVGGTVQFANRTSGGVWSSTNTTVAVVTTGGLAIAKAVGTSNITYTLTNGFGCSNSSFVALTVNPTLVLPSITGSTIACFNPATNITLANTVTGGTWLSSNTTVGTIVSTTGVLTPSSAGQTTVTYSVTNSCGTTSTNIVITVAAKPTVANITTGGGGGGGFVCVGSTTNLSNTTAGGVWSSSNTSFATVNSTSGVVTGVGTGTPTISYTVTTNGCSTSRTTTLNVVQNPNGVNPIGGSSSVCMGTTTTLTQTTTGGTWSSSNTAVATVNSSGVVTPVSIGNATIIYSVPSQFCPGTATKAITVYSAPTLTAITGSSSVCAKNNILLSNSTGGGTWTSNNTSLATINSLGLLTGVSSGKDTIVYSYTNTTTGCTKDTFTIVTINAPTASTINASICPSGSYLFNGTTYTTAGTYTATLTNSVGCDSIATLILTLKTASASTTNASICSNGSYTFNGKTYTTAGTYVATLANAGGCDSIATLVLTVKAISTSTTNASICSNSSYIFNGKTYTTAGTYTATLTNSVGCDSIATLVLTIKSTSSSTTNASICNGSSYTFNGKTYTTAGTYSATLTNSVGCDSIATLILTLKPTSTSTTNASICPSGSYTFNGKTYITAGTYTATLTNSLGCDSIATLVLTLKATSTSTTNASICPSGSYTFNSKTYTTAGTYTSTLTNSVGCDSIATLVLTVKATSTSTTNASICPSGSYTFNGKTYATAGTYTATLTNAVGCDSIATLVLTVKATSTSTTNASICSNGSYTFNGKTYTTAGTYTVTLTNALGCDSIATLVLTIKAISTSTTNASICNGSSYTFNGKTYTTAGTYTAILINRVGCDSIATLVLTVKATSTSTTNASICPSGSYTFNGKTYITAGTYTATLTNSIGCDSIATLVLTVKATSLSITNASICPSGSYTFNGKTYTTAGTYTATLTNSIGCDSIATLVLTVKSTSTSTTNASICPSGSYTFNGKTYTTAGTYTATLTNAVGCDSIATLVLTVKATSTSTTNASICSNGSYTFNGKSYTTAGTYTATLTNALGCDSIATLVLTIKAISTSTTNASICNGSSYTFNGKTYSTAGTYATTLTNRVGCDSIATLVLTVKATSASTTNASICPSGSYTFNGKTYTTAGTYTATLTNSIGCDSIATLVLTVKATSTSTTNASICPSGSYTFNGKTYTTAGTYSATLTNSVGCDSIATLVLTLKATSTSTTNASICSSSSYTFNGKTYTTAGTYTATLTNSVGCDSIATLVLTVTTPVTPTVSINASATTITIGTSVTFTASPTNGGTTPTYQWIKNGANISGATSATYTTSTLSNNDTISCIVKSNLSCVTVAQASSNKLVITVNAAAYTISGSLKNPSGISIPTPSIGVNGTSTIAGDLSGNFSFNATTGSNYTLRPSKNNDSAKNNGVSVIDAILVQSHVLNKSLLNSPYKIIAADVNNSGDVSTIDILYIKRLALGIDTTFTGKRLWAFVDGNYSFTDPTNPFPYKDSLSISSISANAVNQNFVGVKLGDVNYDWDASLSRTNAKVNQPIELYYNNVSSANNNEVRIPIRVKNFKQLLGLQYTINFNSNLLELKAIDNNQLDIDYGINKVKEGKVSFIWNDANGIAKTLNDGSLLFELVFAKKANLNNEALEITSDISSIEAWDENLTKHNIILTAGKISNNIEQVINKETWTVLPNITDGIVNLNMVLSESKDVQLSLSTIDGKQVFTQKIAATKGTSNTTINLQQQGKLSSGIYYLKATGIAGEKVKQVMIK